MYKVLITDDEKKSRMLIENIIRQILPEDVSVTQVDHPVKALRLIEKIKFDLIFMDIIMPQMNGLDVIEQISKKDHNPFIVIVSAHKNFEFAQKGINLGASGYISKPVYKRQFIPIIDKFINKYKQSDIESPDNKTLSLSTSTGYRVINTKSIVFIKKAGRNTVDVFTTEAVIPQVRGILSELLTDLSPDFIYVNRQCIMEKRMISLFNPKTKEIVVKIGNTEKVIVCSRINALTISKLLKT
jgi:Response regulator containing CheY-like receiver domain and AraC-type DNA-binding domain